MKIFTKIKDELFFAKGLEIAWMKLFEYSIFSKEYVDMREYKSQKDPWETLIQR